MNHFGIKPNGPIYSAVIDYLVAEGNVEMAIQCIFSMKGQGIVPELATAQAVVILAAECGYSRLAIELATYFENAPVSQLESSVWIACLFSPQSVCAFFCLFFGFSFMTVIEDDGVMTCWPRVTNNLNVVPNEGVGLAVLGTAARHGPPQFATTACRL